MDDPELSTFHIIREGDGWVGVKPGDMNRIPIRGWNDVIECRAMWHMAREQWAGEDEFRAFVDEFGEPRS
jgi:hypothetical protein